MSDEQPIVHVIDPSAEVLPQEEDPAAPKVGRWYWVRSNKTQDDEEESEPSRWMGCVIHIGSNFVRLEGISGGRARYTTRVHFDNFWARCEFIEDPDSILQAQVKRCQGTVRALMAEVHEITARLSITPGQSLTDGSETNALAVRNDKSIDSYKSALTIAKDKTLPDLFQKIKKANEETSTWMGAQLIPMEAQAKALEPAIGAIKRRIFSVQLYAGLCEEVVQVKEGTPAEVTAKVHLFQRRMYMDEECLAAYEAGGMTFRDLRDFDRWISRPSNMERLLPFPRTIVAFRVRRYKKDLYEDDYTSFLNFFSDIMSQDYDKLTFLYIRNGDQIFRLSTDIEFGADLFPDTAYDEFRGGPAWAHIRHGEIVGLLSEAEYLDLQERKQESLKKEVEKHKGDPGRFGNTSPEHEVAMRFDSYFSEYHPFNSKSVYYDDIAKYIKDKADDHNRLVLVLQGILDRSTVLHPHPPWKLWDAGGFQQALELVFDRARALTETEEPPDFEAYRAKCNASIGVGSITINQENIWLSKEAEKENAKNRYSRSHRTIRHYHPPGNPGPGKFAYVAKYSKKGKTCYFEWGRKPQRRAWDDDVTERIRCFIVVEASSLFNVSAYKPGDFKQFFRDPRTRQNYLKWAPLLIEAEEFHAGNREIRPLEKIPPRPRSRDGSAKYYERKRQKALLKKAVRLRRDIKMRSGKVYKKGSLWRVVSNRGREFSLMGIKPDGQRESCDPDGRWISNASMFDFEVDHTIPAEGIKNSNEPTVEQEPEERENDPSAPTEEEGNGDEHEEDDDDSDLDSGEEDDDDPGEEDGGDGEDPEES